MMTDGKHQILQEITEQSKPPNLYEHQSNFLGKE